MTGVSALISTHNRAWCLEGAIRTALEQTYPDVEVIVVNDGSTDETRSVLEPYADHPDVTVLHNEQNRGISYSHNRGAAAAEGEYLCILDDDDRWHPEKVERQVARFEELSDEYGAVYTGGVLLKDGRVTQWYRPERRGEIYPDVLADFEMHPHSGHMFRRECFEAVGGFDTAFSRGVDWEFAIRFAREWKYDYVDAPLVARYGHHDNISHAPEQIEIFRLLHERYDAEMREYPAVHRRFRRRWYRAEAFSRLRAGRWLAAIWWGMRRLVADPSPTGLLVLLLAVTGPAGFRLGGAVRRRLSDRRSEPAAWTTSVEGRYPDALG